MAVFNIDEIYNNLRNKTFELSGLIIAGANTPIYCDERIAFGPGSLVGSRVEMDCDRELGDIDYQGCELSADDDLGTAVNILLTAPGGLTKPLTQIEDDGADIIFVYSTNYKERYQEIP